MYNHIATEIHKTSLNIQIGILHATGRRNESLHLDLAELFKPLVVDRLIFTLINKRMIQLTDHFETESGGGVLLNAAGKRLFLLAFEKKLYSDHECHGERASYRVPSSKRKFSVFFKQYARIHATSRTGHNLIMKKCIKKWAPEQIRN